MRIVRLHCSALLLSASKPLKTLSTQIAHMTNCKLSFVCSEEWRHLIAGDVSGVRHCGSCKTDVHAVYSESEFEVQKEQGHCVALFLDDGAVTMGMPGEDRIIEAFDPLLNRPTAELDLPSHICDALVGHEVVRIGDVVGLTQAKALEQLRGSQPDVDVLEDLLASRGLTLGMDITAWLLHVETESRPSN